MEDKFEFYVVEGAFIQWEDYAIVKENCFNFLHNSIWLFDSTYAEKKWTN